MENPNKPASFASLVGIDYTEHTLSSERLLTGKLVRVQRDVVRLPDGKESAREYVLHPGAALIAPFIDSETLLFEYQYRHPKGQHYIELPAGKIDAGEAALATAKRELREEAGYEATHWQHATTLHPGIGYSNETIELYVARNLTFVGRELDEGEFLSCFPMSLKEAVAMVGAGKILDTKTAFALLWLDKFQHG
jgi:ADP-ribose pyrophosphatase